MSVPLPTKIVIASRRSALARLQSYAVASQLKAHYPKLEIEFLFKESLGDIHLQSPLWQMPEKGVFTKDLQLDLLEGRCDLVVHSWKDLPIEMPEGTELVATLERADMRDVLLLKPQKAKSIEVLKLLSSSPRRAFNLQRLLPQILPFQIAELSFENIRGNVPTRVRKLLEHTEAQGLILAKAALDRLLAPCPYPDAEVEEFQKQLKGDLEHLRWMVLPLKENPTAPAQGALALEVCRDRADIKQLLKSVDRPSVFEDVQTERRILQRYGGGCHQKIGASVLRLNDTSYLFLKGLSESGELLDYAGSLSRYEWSDRPAQDSTLTKSAEPSRFWPQPQSMPNVFLRENLDTKSQIEAFVKSTQSRGHQPLLIVSRENALPETFVQDEGVFLWCAGLKTWASLARRGYWVSGCFESLGEQDLQEMKFLWPAFEGLKLTHDQGSKEGAFPILCTYRLRDNPDSAAWPKDWSQIEECFWMSSSLFEAALKRFPRLLDQVSNHACGLGHTAKSLERVFQAHPGPRKPSLTLYLSYEEWWKSKGFPAKT